jgi:hypothetical protein
MQGKYVKIKSIRRVENEDVYCLASGKNGTMIANGVVCLQCDALRYAIASAFPKGIISHPGEDQSIDQLRQYVYGDNFNPLSAEMGSGGYF